MGRIIVASAIERHRRDLRTVLESYRHSAVEATTARQSIAEASTGAFDVLIADSDIDNIEGPGNRITALTSKEFFVLDYEIPADVMAAEWSEEAARHRRLFVWRTNVSCGPRRVSQR
jgi:hypothetical protein